MRALVGWLMSLLAIACGGMSDEQTTGGHGGSNGGSAAATQGGTTSQGGTSVQGGAAGTAQGGTGATAPATCSLPIDSGPCEAAIRSYAFDAASGICLPFYYGGCEGNDNRFDTAEDCYRTCEAPEVIGPAECAQSGECSIISTECCPCVGSHWGTVVGVGYSTDANIVRTRCGPIACDSCFASDLAWFGSTCREGHCVAYDARDTEITECSPESGCRLRHGLGCCDGCSPDGFAPIAVNADGRGDELMCPDGRLPCPPPCTEPFPPVAVAECANGRCQVVYPPP